MCFPEWYSASPIFTELLCVLLGNANDFKSELFNWASCGGTSHRLLEDYVGCGGGLFSWDLRVRLFCNKWQKQRASSRMTCSNEEHRTLLVRRCSPRAEGTAPEAVLYEVLATG